MVELDVLPGFTLDDGTHGSKADVVAVGEFSNVPPNSVRPAEYSNPSDFSDILRTEFRTTVSARKSHVESVVFLCAEVQMVDVHTTRLTASPVARVEYVESVVGDSVSENPHGPRCCHTLPQKMHRASFARRKCGHNAIVQIGERCFPKIFVGHEGSVLPMRYTATTPHTRPQRRSNGSEVRYG